MLNSFHNATQTTYVQEGFLLAGKRGIRHVFSRCGAAYRKTKFIVIFAKFGKSVLYGSFKFRLERRIDDPLTNFLTSLC